MAPGKKAVIKRVMHPFRRIPAIIFIAVLHAVPGFSAELPDPEDAEGMIRFWTGLFRELPERYSLTVIDAFEQKTLYFARGNSADHSDVRFLFRKPDRPGYSEEAEMIQNFSRSGFSDERSLFIHTSFNIPGQHFNLYADRPIPVTGRPVRVSLWVHSNLTKNSLSLLFTDSHGKLKEVPVRTLYWKGWKRLDVALPRELYDPKLHAQKSRLSFRGFIVRSPSGSEAKSVSLMIDNLLVLTDIRGIQYPGGEFLDEW